MQIRSERPEDAEAIAVITTDAFEGAPHAGGNEAAIVAALRRSGALAISLVAMENDEAVGHIAFSPVRLDGQAGGPGVRWYALGPVSVRPDRQRRGIGQVLIREGLSRLERLGAPGCVVVGEPAYYGRFGFSSGKELTFLRHPNPYLQGLAFSGPPPRGDVIFDPAFGMSQ